MDLIEVDVVHTEAPQRGIEGCAEVVRRRIVRTAGPDPSLGCEDHAITQIRAALQHRPKQLLRLTEPGATPVQTVDIGGVDQVHTQFQGSLDDGDRIRHLVTHEPPAAEPNRADGTEWSEGAGGCCVEWHDEPMGSGTAQRNVLGASREKVRHERTIPLRSDRYRHDGYRAHPEHQSHRRRRGHCVRRPARRLQSGGSNTHRGSCRVHRLPRSPRQ